MMQLMTSLYIDEDQSERFTRTQRLAQDTTEVFRRLCLATRVYHVNNLYKGGVICQPCPDGMLSNLSNRFFVKHTEMTKGERHTKG